MKTSTGTAAPTGETGSAVILIVDDDQASRRLMAALLEPEGYLTRCAAIGDEVFASIIERKPDLILLDIAMPDVHGYHVATRLKADPHTADIPIIMLASQPDRHARVAGLSAGAEEILTKPVERAELLQRVAHLLQVRSIGDLPIGHSWLLEQKVRSRTAELQRLRFAMDVTSEAIVLVQRASMRFIDVNGAACKMFGYSRADMLRLGPTPMSTLVPADLAATYDTIIAGHAPKGVAEIDIVRKDGTLLTVEVRRQAHNVDGEWLIVTVLRDISDRKQAEQRLHHITHYDILTGLPNRLLFYETLKKTLAVAGDSKQTVALLFIDLDHFKNVNETLGHAVGDALLVEVAARLLQCVRVRDTVGRLGGDEFALIQLSHDAEQDAGTVAARINAAMRAPFIVDAHELNLSASIGITIHPHDACDPDTLIKYADTAMYRAKQAGRDTFCFFTPQMNADVLARLTLERAVRQAVDNDEFVLHYQPKVALRSGRVTGVEALLRWDRPGHGLVPPAAFIGVLGEIGLIGRVGSWAIGTACRQIRAWQDSSIGSLQISVNVSRRQFIDGTLAAEVAAALAASRIPAELLELELTEGSLMVDTGRTIDTLRQLKQLGVQISIDDFGTGYSSLAYLRRFPIDRLKIDIAFIREVTTNPDDAAITRAIIAMAHKLRLDVVAEGVETAAQLAYLRRQRCDHIQGHYFSPALPIAELNQLLLDSRALPPFDGVAAPAPETLLLVDDEASVLAALTRLLRKEGYRILVAQSAAQAFDLLALNEVQVIVCDQRMPVMSGTEFFDCVKDMYPSTFRIVLSGYTDLASIIGAINRGAIYRFYTKPWDNTTLRNDVRDAFRHHALLHENAAAPPDD